MFIFIFSCHQLTLKHIADFNSDILILYTHGRGVYKALKKVNVDRGEWYECAQDRFEWRNVVNRAI